MPDRHVLLGEDAILDMLGREHAVVRREIEAKVSDKVWLNMGDPIYPHNVTVALRRLRAAGKIEETTDTTRGQRSITVIHLDNPRGRRILTKVDRAAARKRLLYGRYRKWSDPTAQYPRGMIGPAGERVVRASFRAVADRGFVPIDRAGSEVFEVLGVPLPGPLDDAHYLTVEDERGMPTLVTLLVEVKNIRQWIYPDYPGVFQLLHKAAVVQQARPDDLICPVLVCRRRSYKALAFAIDLGFYGIQARQQYLLPLSRIDERLMEEVRVELGFGDLRKRDGADPRLAERFIGQSLRGDALPAARRWAETAPALVDEFQTLRDENLPHADRMDLMDELRDHLDAFGPRPDWTNYPDHRGVW